MYFNTGLQVQSMKMFLFGNRIYQYLASISATLCIISSEMHFGWTSPSLPQLISGAYYFRISEHEASWLAVILLAGTIVGALIAGKLNDVLGRKKVILLTAVPLLVGWIMIGIARDKYVLFVARFVSGMSSGLAFSTVPMYLGEIAEPDVRGLLASLCPVCVVLGILLINILGNYLPIDTTAFISSIFPVLLLATFIWMPESPSYLIQKRRCDEAEAALVVLRGEEEARKELERLTAGKTLEAHTKASVLDLVRDKVNRRAMFIAYGLRTIQQFCGTSALTFYCKTIFEEAKDILPSSVSTIVYFSLQLVVAFLAIFVVDRIGRRPLLIVSLIGTSLTLFVLGGYFFAESHVDADFKSYKIIPFLALFLNVALMSIGARNVPLLYISELFSPSIKPQAVGVGTIFYSLVAILAAKLFFFTNQHFGLYMPFMIYAVVTLAGVFFVVYCVPETKGMSLEDIQERLGKSGSRATLEEKVASVEDGIQKLGKSQSRVKLF